MTTVFCVTQTPQTGQKNFVLGPARAAFEAWCRANGYDEKTVFLAGFLSLAAMQHDDRVRLFALTETWKTKGFTLDGVRPSVLDQSRPAEKEPSRGSRRAAS